MGSIILREGSAGYSRITYSSPISSKSKSASHDTLLDNFIDGSPFGTAKIKKVRKAEQEAPIKDIIAVAESFIED